MNKSTNFNAYTILMIAGILIAGILSFLFIKSVYILGLIILILILIPILYFKFTSAEAQAERDFKKLLYGELKPVPYINTYAAPKPPVYIEPAKVEDNAGMKELKLEIESLRFELKAEFERLKKEIKEKKKK